MLLGDQPYQGWEGAFYIRNVEDSGAIDAVYVYPDWNTCVEGTWKNLTLISGWLFSVCPVKDCNFDTHSAYGIDFQAMASFALTSLYSLF